MHTAKSSSHVVLAAATGVASAGWAVTAYRLQQARTDELTRLPCRGQWEKRAARWLRAHPGPLRMIVADLDRFKHLNDTHGHPTGDVVLHTTAQRLRRALPAPSRMLATRLGGDEFAALITQPRPEDEMLLRTCLSLPIPLPDGTTLPVSASLGSVLLPAPPHRSPSVSTAVATADNTMYHHKQHRTPLPHPRSNSCCAHPQKCSRFGGHQRAVTASSGS